MIKLIMTQGKVYVIGIGVTKFYSPGTRENFDYPEMSKEAVEMALRDARILYTDIKQAVVGYLWGDSTCGQRCLYQFGMTGIPIYNVNNNGATGGTALCLAKQLVDAGSDCVLTLGFEKMTKGELGKGLTANKKSPLDKHFAKLHELSPITDSPIIPQFYGNAGIEHMKKHRTTLDDFAKVAMMNRNRGSMNHFAQSQRQYSLKEILDSPKVSNILTRLQCCPKSDGAAAVVLANEDFIQRHGLEERSVEVLAIEMATDTESTFSDSIIKLIGYDMTALATQKAFQKAGRSPVEVDVVEMHDCFSTTQLVMLPALGFSGSYKAVINPSGGLIGRGHPISATGVAQCAELVRQLRGEAGAGQVQGARLGLQHSSGLGGAAVAALYSKL